MIVLQCYLRLAFWILRLLIDDDIVYYAQDTPSVQSHSGAIPQEMGMIRMTDSLPTTPPRSDLSVFPALL